MKLSAPQVVRWASRNILQQEHCPIMSLLAWVCGLTNSSRVQGLGLAFFGKGRGGPFASAWGFFRVQDLGAHASQMESNGSASLLSRRSALVSGKGAVASEQPGSADPQTRNCRRNPSIVVLLQNILLNTMTRSRIRSSVLCYGNPSSGPLGFLPNLAGKQRPPG